MIDKLYDEIATLFKTFEVEHQSNVTGNKAAGRRARKAIGEIKKLVTPYKKESVTRDKTPV
jgi:hypothetical protein